MSDSYEIYGVLAFSLVLIIILTSYFFSKLQISGLHKRFVFITGCDTGFGNLLARTLDQKGVNVIAGCLRQETAQELKDQTSSRLKTVLIDIGDKESVEKAYQITKEVLHKNELWGLVNNAGIMPSHAPVEWTPLETYQYTLQVNLLGTVSVTLTFLPLLRQSRGRLVNVCSVVSNCGYPGFSDYVISKAGVKMFTTCLRRELFNSGVTAHTIEPGGFKTGITDKDRVFSMFHSAYTKVTPEIQKFYGGNIAKKVLLEMHAFSIYKSQKLQPVVDAMTHALFAKYPKTSYLVGPDARIFFRILSWLPEKVVDHLLGWPKPYGPLCEDLTKAKLVSR